MHKKGFTLLNMVLIILVLSAMIVPLARIGMKLNAQKAADISRQDVDILKGNLLNILRKDKALPAALTAGDARIWGSLPNSLQQGFGRVQYEAIKGNVCDVYRRQGRPNSEQIAYRDCFNGTNSNCATAPVLNDLAYVLIHPGADGAVTTTIIPPVVNADPAKSVSLIVQNAGIDNGTVAVTGGGLASNTNVNIKNDDIISYITMAEAYTAAECDKQNSGIYSGTRILTKSMPDYKSCYNRQELYANAPVAIHFNNGAKSDYFQVEYYAEFVVAPSQSYNNIACCISIPDNTTGFVTGVPADVTMATLGSGQFAVNSGLHTSTGREPLSNWEYFIDHNTSASARVRTLPNVNSCGIVLERACDPTKATDFISIPTDDGNPATDNSTAAFYFTLERHTVNSLEMSTPIEYRDVDNTSTVAEYGKKNQPLPVDVNFILFNGAIDEAGAERMSRHYNVNFNIDTTCHVMLAKNPLSSIIIN